MTQVKYEPYHEYHDSKVAWLGEVPAHWEVMAIKRLVSVPVTDGPHETPTFIDDGVPFLSAEGVSSGVVDFNRIRGFISEALDVQYSKKYSPKRHDIFMVKSGATTGVTAIVETDRHFNIWSPLAVIRCNADTDPHFTHFFLRSRNFQEAVELNWTFGTQQNIGMGVIENLHVARPPLNEASQIAKFLDYETAKIDALIEKQQQLIALLKEKRQAVISHAVTKGLNPDAPMRDSGVEWLGEVPAHWFGQALGLQQPQTWRPTRLKYESTLKGRLGWQGLKADEYLDEGPHVVSSAHFDHEHVHWKKCPRVSPERYALDSNIQLAPHDILLMKDGAALGKLAYVHELPGPACLNSHLLLLRPKNESYDSRYIFHVLCSDVFQDYMQVSGTGATFMGVSQQAIGDFPLPLPPIKEQRRIAEAIDAQLVKLDDLVEAAIQASVLLGERRTALISAAVTGKIDVRGWKAPESAVEEAIV